MIRTVVGLRPFRPSGFVVSVETMGPKTIVHDYGHGGAGVTLSWGTAHLAIDAAAIPTGERAAVLGCGAVGLATARLLQRRGIAVTIYARDLPPETTSNIAGAHWSPFMVADKSRRTPAFNDMLDRAARISNRAFQDLIGDRYGVRWIENYLLLAQRPNDAPGSRHDLTPGWKVLGPGEHPFASPYVTSFMSMLIEPPVYLNALIEDVQRAGGSIVVRDFADRAAILSLPETFVFNCTGLGSAALFGDTELIPVKGQLSVLVPQPEIGYVAMKDDLYMFPRRDGIVLGGTHERGICSLEPNLDAARSILAAHREVFRQMS